MELIARRSFGKSSGIFLRRLLTRCFGSCLSLSLRYARHLKPPLLPRGWKASKGVQEVALRGTALIGEQFSKRDAKSVSNLPE